MCEQIKVDKNRVNIEEMKSTDLDDENITGGYLLEFDSYFDEINKFRSEICDLPVMFKEPDEETLQPAQFDYMRDYINRIESILYAPNFTITREYQELIDIPTFIDWWLVQELVYSYEPQNPGSCYFYKDRSGPLKAGPIWDFDWGTFRFGTDFLAKDALWYGQLFKDRAFVEAVKSRWELLKPRFKEVIGSIETEGNRISVSVELNDALWSLSNRESINEDEKLAHKNAVQRMRQNCEQRLNWLDSQIRNF